MRDLRAQGFNVELIHRVDRTGFKAGALEEGLTTCKGEFILILDADFVPAAGHPEEDDPLFHRSEGRDDPDPVGAPEPHLLAAHPRPGDVPGRASPAGTNRPQPRAAASSISTAPPASGAATCIEAAGGWQHDTLTEDLDLSYRAQLKGWKFVFLADLVTPAELPGRHERLQVPAAPLDEGLDPDLQKASPGHLAEQPPASASSSRRPRTSPRISPTSSSRSFASCSTRRPAAWGTASGARFSWTSPSFSPRPFRSASFISARSGSFIPRPG